MSQSRADFAICKRGGPVLKVQVKKATWSKSGKGSYLQTRLVSRNLPRRFYKPGDFDVLAVVDGDGRMWLYSFDEVKDKTSLSLDKK